MAKSSLKDPQVAMDRRTNNNRRDDKERREEITPVENERRTNERRTKVTRRRQIDPTTCERDYTNDEIEFMRAMDDYKRRNGRMFPTCSEILEVIRDLGYVRPGSVLSGDAEELSLEADAQTEESLTEDLASSDTTDAN